MTLAAVTDNVSAGVQLDVLPLPATVAADNYDVSCGQSGRPRRIFEEVEREDLSLLSLLLSGRPLVDSEQAAGALLGWVVRMLEAEFEPRSLRDVA